MKINRHSRKIHDPLGLHRPSGSVCDYMAFVGTNYDKMCNYNAAKMDKTKTHEFTLERFVRNKRSIEKTRP